MTGSSAASDALIESLVQSAEERQIFLLIDAVDECSESEELLLPLAQLIRDSPSVGIFLTGRNLFDVSRKLERHRCDKPGPRRPHGQDER
jgi:hypothetical protein